MCIPIWSNGFAATACSYGDGITRTPKCPWGGKTLYIYFWSIANDLIQKAQAALSAVINATELLQSHTQNLQQASVKASGINEDLDKAVLTAQTWQDSVSPSGSMPDWAVRVICPAVTFVLGGHGMPRTALGNLALVGSGKLLNIRSQRIRQLTDSRLRRWWNAREGTTCSTYLGRCLTMEHCHLSRLQKLEVSTQRRLQYAIAGEGTYRYEPFDTSYFRATAWGTPRNGMNLTDDHSDLHLNMVWTEQRSTDGKTQALALINKWQMRHFGAYTTHT